MGACYGELYRRQKEDKLPRGRNRPMMVDDIINGCMILSRAEKCHGEQGDIERNGMKNLLVTDFSFRRCRPCVGVDLPH